jgi:polyhydroxyalkanoate synthesis regulator phasin
MTIEINLDDNGKHWLSDVREQKRKERAAQFDEKKKERLRSLKSKLKTKRDDNGKI